MTDKDTRIADLEAQLAEVRRKIQERADWHKCSCPHPCDDYNVFPGGCSGKYRQDYISILSALEATPPAPPGWSRVTEDDGAKYLNPPDGWLNTELTTPPAPTVTEEFKQYRRKQVAELRPWSPGECMDSVSVSGEDAKAGSPKLGDMIARNPKNHDDKWLVAAAYFADNFEPLPTLTAAQEAGKP